MARILPLAANMEWLFTEAGQSTADRIRAAAAHGVDAVEIWGWREKDIDSVHAALAETGMPLLSLIVDPQLNIGDPSTHEEYRRGVAESLVVAQKLNAPNLVVVAGLYVAELSPAQQHAAVVDALKSAAEIVAGSGVSLLLEPLNSRVDHLGTYLSTTAEGLAIIREVGRSEVRLLLDAYHALMMGENLVAELDGSIDLVGHVQVADIPGRNEPGSGVVDWRAFVADLQGLGYRGAIGLEYMPLTETPESMRAIEAELETSDV